MAWCLDIEISLIAIACLKLTDIVNIDIVYNFFLSLGLMIGAFAKAGSILGDDVYLKRAIKAATFTKKYLWNNKLKKLARSCYRDNDGGVVQL